MYNEDSAALVDNSNMLHVCTRVGAMTKCGALVKHHYPSSQTWGGRPECPYCECNVIEYLMSKGDCSRTRALEALELNDWNLLGAMMGLMFQPVT